MIKPRLKAIFAGVLLCLWGKCGTGPVSDTGGASETVAVIVTDSAFYGNAVSVNEEGLNTVNPHVALYFYESDFLPVLPLSINNVLISAISDSNGQFNTPHKGTGYYSLYAKDGITGKRLFRDSIKVSAGVVDTINIDFDLTGSITGQISVVDTGALDTMQVSDYYIYIVGSPFWAISGSSGYFTLDTLPKGSYAMRATATLQDTSWINVNEMISKLTMKPSIMVSVNASDTTENSDIFVLQK